MILPIELGETMSYHLSYTKKGSGRRHNYFASKRTIASGELRGNKLARKAKRKILTLRHWSKYEVID